jgi:hypothetical protein
LASRASFATTPMKGETAAWVRASMPQRWLPVARLA